MELRVLSLSRSKNSERAGLVLLAMLAPACAPASADKPASSPVRERASAGAAPAPRPAPTVAERGAVATADQEASEPGQRMLPAAVAGATNASLGAEPVPAAENASYDLPKGTTVLHIGDSFAGALGIELNREFKDAGVRGILKYETATYIPTWAWGKDLEKYLSKYHPDLVLITLGANELEIPDPAQRGPTIRHLVERLAGRPCVWVAPPLWHGARPALLDVIRESCAPCAYLDSGELVPALPRAKDGIHPAMAARKEWARAVIKWLGEHRRARDGQPWSVE
jgi:hypothetical protein